ncbi:MAG: hypothetical protein O3A00_01475 [Planctomycetota bacterium]|nr:hypothetical protein [Planctomycetota bacterium]
MPDADSAPEYFTVVCSTCAARIDAPVEELASQVKCPDCFVMVRVPSRADVDAHLDRNRRRPIADVETYGLAGAGTEPPPDTSAETWSTLCPICTARLTPDLRDVAYTTECHDCYTKVNVPSAAEAKELRSDRFRDKPNPGSYRLSLPSVPEYEVDVPMEESQPLLKATPRKPPPPPPPRGATPSFSADVGSPQSGSHSVTCEKCGTALNVEPKRFTRRVTCDECGAKVSVPGVKDLAATKSTPTAVHDDDIFSVGPPKSPSPSESQRTKKRPMKAAPPKKSVGSDAASRASEGGDDRTLDRARDDEKARAPKVVTNKVQPKRPLDLESDDIPTLAAIPDDDEAPPRRKRKKKKKRKSGFASPFTSDGDRNPSQDYEPSPEGGFLAVQSGFRIVDDGDPPPEHAYFSNVFEFPWNEPVRMRWVWMSVLLGAFGFAVGLLRVFWSAAGGMTAAIPIICVVLVFLGIFVFGYVAANCMRIIEETAAGSDRIRTWPSSSWREWFPDLMVMAWFLGLSVTMAAVPTGIVRAILGADVAHYAFAITVYVMFPIMLLSSSEANSMIPVSLPILQSIVVLVKDWACFCGLSFATTLPLVWILGSIPKSSAIYAYALSGPAFAAVILINARLLGRLGWSIVQKMEPPEPEETDDEDEEVVRPL